MALRPVIVFDLDHTLISPIIRRLSVNGEPRPLKEFNLARHQRSYPNIEPDMRITNMEMPWLPGKPTAEVDIYVRSWAHRVLAMARERYGRVGIWTFSRSPYAIPIVRNLLGMGVGDLEFLYTWDNPPPGWKGIGKPLDVIIANHGGPAFMVEDTPENCVDNPDNCMIISRDDCGHCSAPCLGGEHCRTSNSEIRRLAWLADSLSRP